MDRVTLEKAWADSYCFENATVPASVKLLSQIPAKILAEEVYAAAMELRDEGINWYGSDFEDELLEIIEKGEAVITNPDVHISLMEYKEIVEFKNNIAEKGLDAALAEAKAKAKSSLAENHFDNSKGKDAPDYMKD